eukprot:gb/GEZN01013636.1/.p1 GENE.gb/GEZN01013636.1/~~gb/GEZN01013636.1/.p1  ORF type:complete len:269 (-),score=11.86 gb/GEZN01013636.1/:147-953(-)
MSKEIVSPEGLRLDGRRAQEVRKMSCLIGLFDQMDGSACFQQGNTQVIATVLGPHETRRRTEALHDRALVTCEWSLANFATSERKTRSKQDRRSKEMANLIKQTFESVILTDLFPRTQIDIQIQVVLEDGGALSASINAASMALVNAGIPMKDLVCACSAGFIESTAIVDLNFSERTRNTPEICVAVFPKAAQHAQAEAVQDTEDGAPVSVEAKEIAMIHMSNKIPLTNFAEVVDLATEGCLKVHEVVKAAVQSYSKGVMSSRGVMQA